MNSFGYQPGGLGSGGQLEARVVALENKILKVYYYAEITAVSGQISAPQGATILLDQWANGEDALVCKIVNDKPDYNESDAFVDSFDTSGNYTLSGSLPTNPAALIYVFEIKRVDFDSYVDTDYIVDYVELENETGVVVLAQLDADIEVKEGVASFPFPENGTMLSVFIGCSTAPTGSDAIWDWNVNGSSILSTKITIEAGEYDSLSAANQPVFSSPDINKGDKVIIDCAQIGATVAGKNPVLIFTYKKR